MTHPLMAIDRIGDGSGCLAADPHGSPVICGVV